MRSNTGDDQPLRRGLGVRARTTLVATATFGVIATVGAVWAVHAAEAHLLDNAEADAAQHLDTVADDLVGRTWSPGSPLPSGGPGITLALLDENGRIIDAGTIGDTAAEGNDQPAGGALPTGEIVAGSIGPLDADTDVAVASQPVELDGRELTLTAVVSTKQVRDAVNTLSTALWLGIPAALAIVAASTWMLAGRALRPVEAITTKVNAMDLRRLDDDVPVPAAQDEIATLATTINRLLGRLRSARDRQRAFVSDASHELRSPVAASRTMLQVALADPGGADWPTTASAVLEEQARLGQLVDNLLLLATLDETSAQTQREFDLDDVIVEEAHPRRSPVLSLDRLDPARIVGDPAKVRIAIRNVIDNAIRHANTKVAVSLTTDGGWATVAIRDDGNGIRTEDHERILERFVRLDEARSRDAGGSGLGLAVTNTVVATHRGTLEIDSQPGAGATFRIQLPLASAEDESSGGDPVGSPSPGWR